MARKSPLRDWEKIPRLEGESIDDKLKRAKLLLSLRKKVKQTIKALKHIKTVNSGNHAWEEAEIERLNEQLSGVFSLECSLSIAHCRLKS